MSFNIKMKIFYKINISHFFVKIFSLFDGVSLENSTSVRNAEVLSFII